MNLLKLMLAGASAMAAVATAAQAATIFEGRLVVESAVGCTLTKVGDRVSGSYHIANLPGNSNKSILTLVSDLEADGYLITGYYDTTFKPAAAATTRSGVSVPFAAQVKINATPTAVNTTAASSFILMTLQIKNRNNDPGSFGCLARFRGAFTRR